VDQHGVEVHERTHRKKLSFFFFLEEPLVVSKFKFSVKIKPSFVKKVIAVHNASRSMFKHYPRVQELVRASLVGIKEEWAV
jgi:hypothetical protein